MAQYQDHAVVLKVRAYREHDSLVTIFGLKAGKVGAIAKGVRRAKSRLAGGVRPLSYSVLELYQGRSSLQVINEAALVDGFSKIPEDLERLSWGMMLADLVAELWAEHEASPETFSLLVAALQSLNEGRNAATVGLTGAWHLLRVAGYQSDWTHCGVCRSPLTQGPIAIDIAHLQPLCAVCRNASGIDGLSISLGSIRSLQYWMTLYPKKFGQVEVKGGMKEELFSLLERYVGYHLGRIPRSFEFVRTVSEGTGSEGK